MSRTIEIRGLNDAQCEALAEEAKAAGHKFYDHCRNKLLANTTVAMPVAWVSGEVSPTLQRHVPEAKRVTRLAPEPDRIGRLEEMMARMGETLQLLASNPAQLVQPEPVADEADIDVDDVIGQSLAMAEEQGLTVIEREEPAQNGGVRHIGQRRPAPYSVHTVPTHLRNL